MTKPTITLTFTIEETQWLRDSLSVACSAFANVNAETMRQWTMKMAKGLDAKIEAAKRLREAV